MGKTRDLFKKIRDTKGTFHAKRNTIKDSHGMDLTEAYDYAKAFDYMDHNKLVNCETDGNTRPPDLPLEKPVCKSGSNC